MERNKDIRLIVCDLDGTLINSNGAISDNNLEILERLYRRGIRFALCSGRPKVAMDKYVKLVRERGVGKFVIAYNGVVVYDRRDIRMTYTHLNKQNIDKLIDASKQWGITIQLYKDEVLYVNKINKYVQSYVDRTNMPVKEVEDLKQIDTSYKALFNYKDCEKFDNFKKYLVDEFPHLNIFNSNKDYIEVVPEFSSKAYAVSYLASVMGFKREQILCIGDAFNDISMIEYAGVGVAMANASDEVKQAADYVANSNNDGDILVEVYNKYFE